MTTRLAEEVWRSFTVDGVPSSGNHKPKKSDIRLWGSEIEALLDIVIAGGGFVYATKAALDADLAKAAGSGAWVYADTTAANNGIYRKIGNSGTGSWTRATDLPQSVIGLTVTGGTANAIQCSSTLPVPQANRSALFILLPTASNTGAVTLEINGASPVALKWQAGEDLGNGHLQANVPVLFFKNGSEFRLTQDDSFAGMLAAAQTAAATATTQAGIATTQAGIASSQASTATTQAGNAAASASSAASSAAGAALVSGALPRIGLAGLKALNTESITVAYCTDASRRAMWVWQAGNFSSQIAADSSETRYVKADAIAASAGAWVRANLPNPSTWAAGVPYLAGEQLRYRMQAVTLHFEVASDHISAANPITDIIAGRLTLVSERRRQSGAITYPVGYTGRTINVWRRADGTYSTPYDYDYAFRTAFMCPPGTTGMAGNVTYWVSQSGNDTNSGLTRALALKTIAAAMGKSDVGTIMVEGSDTHYEWTAPGTKSINVIRYGDKWVRLFTPPGGGVWTSWARTGALTKVWNISTTNVAFVPERPCSAAVVDENGIPLGYKEVFNTADVQATPYSFYIDTSVNPRVIHVHSEAEPVIGSDIYLTIQNWRNHTFSAVNTNTDKIIYLEGLCFTHTTTALSSTGGNFRALNCASIGGQNTSLVAWSMGGTTGLADIILLGCIGAYSGSDAFNISGSACNYTEIRCKAYGNGSQGSSSQASSVHVGVNALRIECEFELNAQQAITDVGTGTTVNIGCKFGGPSNVSCIAATTSRAMWNIDCVMAGAGIHYENTSSIAMIVDGPIDGVRTSGNVLLAAAV